MRGFISGLIIGLVIGVILAVASPQTETLKDSESEAGGPELRENMGTTVSPVKWRLSSVLPEDIDLSAGARRVAERITSLTRTGVKVSFHAPDSQAKGLDLFNAVSSGTIEAVFSNPTYWGDKSRGFDFLAGVPFGPTGDEFLTWYHQGGGEALADALFRRFNIKGVLCGLAGPIAGSLFTAPVNFLSDLSNKSIAATGLSALVLKRAGAQVVTKTQPEVMLSIRGGTLFGSVSSHPLALNQDFLSASAKHLYFPGWFQQVSPYFLMIHLRDWSGLSKIAQMRIQAVCAENIINSFVRSEGTQFKRLKKMINQGADIREWPAQMVASLRVIWAREAQRLSRNDQDFRRLWSSLKTFQRDHKIWKELGYL